MTSYSRMQEMKRAIYAMRNGVVADALRSAGSPYRFIMGVNLPQLKEIAGRFGRDAALAAELRADTACRESQLMAPLVADPDAVDAVDAQKWLLGSTSREATDILCHALLRHRDDALDLARGSLSGDGGSDDVCYAGLRLLWNLVAKYPVKCLSWPRLRSLPGVLRRRGWLSRWPTRRGLSSAWSEVSVVSVEGRGL